ncbi:MAG: hypothetical protein BroJett011_11160 [Chloroflexota bacterium]|nr:MAG: hypothetical protein BroJett011_11160 [Chloroflexota bacterium]
MRTETIINDPKDLKDHLANPRELVFREINLLGSHYASKSELLEAAELVETGRFQPVVSHIVPPENVDQVHQELRKSSLIGRGAVVWMS